MDEASMEYIRKRRRANQEQVWSLKNSLYYLLGQIPPDLVY